MAEDGMTILKDAIGKGGEQRTRAFDFIDTKFGSDMKSGGKRALETYRELYAIAQLAGGQGACKEFTERFYAMLPEATRNELPFDVFSNAIREEAAQIDAKKRGFFSRIFRA
jgi:hypothetical protein